MSMLRIESLRKAFGSLVVTDNVTLDIPRGERHVIIGPNGAGKTSLVNQIGGQLRSDSGRIELNGATISGLPPEQIWHSGLSRTFQRNNLFRNLTVLENVRLALQEKQHRSLNFFTPVTKMRGLIEEAHRVLTLVNLGDVSSYLVHSLSYGEQRQLEIAIALASDPVMLLLDEPTSGMSPVETGRMVELLGTLSRHLTILMIEHDMQVVFSIADRITVLYLGGVLASGRPEEVSANERVREVYLGLTH